MIVLLFCIQSIPSIQGTSFAIPIAQLFYDAVGPRLAQMCIFTILFAQWAASLVSRASESCPNRS